VDRRERDEIVTADKTFSDRPGARVAMREMLEEPGEDEQATIRPPPALDEERPEIRWSRAEGQAGRVIVESPAASDQLDSGFGVLDNGAILDELSDAEPALHRLRRDVIERAFPHDRIRPDPIGRAVVREPLVDDVLHVGGRAGDPLQEAGRSRKR